MSDLSFAPQRRDLALYSGDPAAIRLTVKMPDGSPVSLDGEVRAEIRHHRADADPAAEFAVDLTDAATGVALLQLTGAQTSSLMNGADPMYGSWDVQWLPTDGQPLTLVQGDVRCNLDVTR